MNSKLMISDDGKMMLDEVDTFVEIEIKDIIEDVVIGTAEIEPNKHALERFEIFLPYRNKGYGTKALNMLIEKYGITNLWVRSDNEQAIHLYKKFGFQKYEETMYEMRRWPKAE